MKTNNHEWQNLILAGNVAALRWDRQKATCLWDAATVIASEVTGLDARDVRGISLYEAYDTEADGIAEHSFYDAILQSAEDGTIAFLRFLNAYPTIYDELVDEKNYAAAKQLALEALALTELVFWKECPACDDWLVRLNEVSVALGETGNAEWFKSESNVRRQSIEVTEHRAKEERRAA